MVITDKTLSPLEKILTDSYEAQRAIARHLDRVSYDRLRSTSRSLRYYLPGPKDLQRKKQLNKWLTPSCNETRNSLIGINLNQRYILRDKVDKIFRMYYPPIKQPIPCAVSPPAYRTQSIRCDYGIGGHHKPGEFFFCKNHQWRTRRELDEFSHLARGAIHRLCDGCMEDRLKSASIANDRFTHTDSLVECGCASEFIGLKKLVESQNKCRFCSLRPFFDWHLENQRIRDAQNCRGYPMNAKCSCETCFDAQCTCDTCIGCHKSFNAGGGGTRRCKGFECSRCKKGYFANLPANLPAAVDSDEAGHASHIRTNAPAVPCLRSLVTIIHHQQAWQ
jgi:hypothetical protein